MEFTNVTESSFAPLVEKSPVPFILEFWAPWCGPCRMMEPVYREVVTEHPGIGFGRVNADEEPALCSKFDVMAIPTILVFVNGEVVKKLLGAKPKKRLLEELAPWLNG